MTIKVTLSCTTFFREDFSIESFIQNFSSLFEKNTNLNNSINELIIINEYSTENSEKIIFHSELIKSSFPSARFIQKNESQRGQAHSLNMILNLIEKSDYHIQWEEGWICTKPFLKDAIGLLEHSNFQQIGLTSDWFDTPLLQAPQLNMASSVLYRELMLDSRYKHEELTQLNSTNDNELVNQMMLVNLNIWPLFSLRPSVNRISFIEKLPRFNTNEKLWPVRFEFLYAFHWLNHGGRKAMLADPRSVRSSNKVGTYNKV